MRSSADQRNHDFRPDLGSLLLNDRGGLEHRARLHLRDFREVDAKAAATEAEHRIELVKLLDARVNLLRWNAELAGEILLLLRRVRQELVEGRIEEADRRRIA